MKDQRARKSRKKSARPAAKPAKAKAAKAPPRWWTRGTSRIHRHGLFAASDIPRGTRVIEYKGVKLTKAEGWRRANAWMAHAENSGKGEVYVFELNSRYDIDGNVPWNTARHINHSCVPNCDPRTIDGHIWIVARRRIRAGEEITYDYGYSLDGCLDHPCRCGTPRCVGYIVAREHRAQLKRQLARERSPAAG